MCQTQDVERSRAFSGFSGRSDLVMKIGRATSDALVAACAPRRHVCGKFDTVPPRRCRYVSSGGDRDARLTARLVGVGLGIRFAKDPSEVTRTGVPMGSATNGSPDDTPTEVETAQVHGSRVALDYSGGGTAMLRLCL